MKISNKARSIPHFESVYSTLYLVFQKESLSNFWSYDEGPVKVWKSDDIDLYSKLRQNYSPYKHLPYRVELPYGLTISHLRMQKEMDHVFAVLLSCDQCEWNMSGNPGAEFYLHFNQNTAAMMFKMKL